MLQQCVLVRCVKCIYASCMICGIKRNLELCDGMDQTWETQIASHFRCLGVLEQTDIHSCLVHKMHLKVTEPRVWNLATAFANSGCEIQSLAGMISCLLQSLCTRRVNISLHLTCEIKFNSRTRCELKVKNRWLLLFEAFWLYRHCAPSWIKARCPWT